MAKKLNIGSKGTLSTDWISVISGVQQGSVLGPILFNVCVNDVDYSITCKIKKITDDKKKKQMQFLQTLDGNSYKGI